MCASNMRLSIVCVTLLWMLVPSPAQPTHHLDSACYPSVGGAKEEAAEQRARCLQERYRTGELQTVQDTSRAVLSAHEQHVQRLEQVVAMVLRLEQQQATLNELLRELVELKTNVSGPAPLPPHCPAGYSLLTPGRGCYRWMMKPSTWAEAKADCALTPGAGLLEVYTAAELSAFAEFLTDMNLSANVEDLSAVTPEQTAPLLKVGVRVVRGRDWSWGNQDGEGPTHSLGTVIQGRTGTKWIRVAWDNSHTNNYRMGNSGKYDLALAFTESRILVWTSARKIAGQWRWSSGEAVEYVKWSPGQPDNAGKNESCLQLLFSPDGGSLTMNDYSCNAKAFYMCQLVL